MKMITIIHGSQLYGLNTPESDTDFKSIYMPPMKEIILGNFKRSFDMGVKVSDGIKNSKEDVDHIVYSMHEFVKMLIKGEMVAIDMIHAPSNMIKSTDEDLHKMFLAMQTNVDLFYSKNMASFMGYIKHQAAKYGIKGSRLRAVRDLIAQLSTLTPNRSLVFYRSELINNEYIVCSDEFYEVLGKKYSWNLTVEYVLHRVELMEKGYGERAKQAESNEGVDFKAISHAFRAAFQLKQIFSEEFIKFPFEGKEKQLLLDVKAGKIPYVELEPMLEKEVDDVEKMAAASTLPDTVNVENIEDYMAFLMGRYYGVKLK